MAGRPYELVLFGATGFTGRLVAEYLVRHGRSLRWAIAGRSQSTLRDLKSGLVGVDPAAGEVGIVVADASDPHGLAELCASTSIVASTVGPYGLRGHELLRAAISKGTHYLDITGEPAFVAGSRHTHADSARRAGVRVVHCCGFDSIPADLGVLYTVRQLEAEVPKSVRGYLRVDGRPSGGTWATLLDSLHRPPPRTARGSGGGRSRLPSTIHRERDAGWAIPLPVIDPMIVRATARERPDDYGPDFAYGQYLRVDGPAQALKLGVGMAALWTAAQSGVTRRWLEARIPAGTGPDARQRARSSFELLFVGEGGGQRILTRVAGGDPGYDETSKMLAESALLLAHHPSTLPDVAGVLSPAAAFGPALVERLQTAGLVFERLP